MTRHKRSPAPAGRPDAGRFENELGNFPLDHSNINLAPPTEAFAAAWLARHGIRPVLASTILELARIGGAL